MPELPEVETIRRELSRRVINKTIQSVKIIHQKIIHTPIVDFVYALKGNKFHSIQRTGKLLQFFLEGGEQVMLVHLKMTGQLLINAKPRNYANDANENPDKHTHVIIKFEDGSELTYRDVRKFGYMKLVSLDELEQIKRNYGIEPLQENFTLSSFQDIFKKRKKSLKSILLDQQLIAGLGNIYVDEVCFRAGIRPSRAANKIKKSEFVKLYEACEEIIARAIEFNGTTFSDYMRTGGDQGEFAQFLQVYGKAGEECTKCSSPITKIKLAGRGTHYCENCQG